jgi:hypothetical protein
MYNLKEDNFVSPTARTLKGISKKREDEEGGTNKNKCVESEG